MNAAQPPSQPSVGRLTGFVLGLVTFLCMILIGAAGYVKYEIDRAESVMAAPGSAFTVDQEIFEQLRRSLGYSGFVGYAQSFVATHDPNNLSDMRAQVNIASETVARLPPNVPGESRHDAQAIVAVFQAALQKAEKSTDASGFTTADMVPLYSALPVLDSRLESAAAVSRLEAQNHLQFWSMLLTLVSWASLIIASSLAVSIYLTLRDRNSAPLRALAQSVKNMARGDMRASIWGMERTDMIGELARAVDLARYNFSQLPDMSLLSEQGPVRLKFEGNTRSLFEAMMRVISRDSEQVRMQAVGLGDAIVRQQEAISLISSRVEAVLHNIEKRGLDGDQHLRSVLQNMTSSAQSLRNAQEHASDQLNRILPFLQDRAQGMAEITQITGKQVAQVLASLTLSERGLRSSAEHSEDAIKKLSSVADSLGERMFGAVNLLQASGKVLAETTEKTQSRLNEAVDALTSSVANVSAATSEPQATVLDVSPRLEQIAGMLEASQQRLEMKINEMSQQSAAMPQPSAQPDAAVIARLLESIQSGFEATTREAQEIKGHYERLQELVQSKPVEVKVEAPPQPQIDPALVENILAEVKSGFHEVRSEFEATAKRIGDIQAKHDRLQELALSRPPIEVKIDPHQMQPAQPPAFMRDFMEEVRTGLDLTSARIESIQAHYAQMEDLVQTRPPIEVRVDQPTQAPPFARDLMVEFKSGFETINRQIGQLREQFAAAIMASAAAPQTASVSSAGEQLQAQWYQMVGQIEATKTALEQTIVQQIDRLGARLESVAPPTPQVDPAAFSDTQKQMEQQTQILEELVATLGMLDTHMQQLKSEIGHQKLEDAMQAARL